MQVWLFQYHHGWISKIHSVLVFKIKHIGMCAQPFGICVLTAFHLWSSGLGSNPAVCHYHQQRQCSNDGIVTISLGHFAKVSSEIKACGYIAFGFWHWNVDQRDLGSWKMYLSQYQFNAANDPKCVFIARDPRGRTANFVDRKRNIHFNTRFILQHFICYEPLGHRKIQLRDQFFCW